jgi:hypothetical protein
MYKAQETYCIFKDFVGNPEGNRSLGSPIHNGRIILKQILNKWNGRM